MPLFQSWLSRLSLPHLLIQRCLRKALCSNGSEKRRFSLGLLLAPPNIAWCLLLASVRCSLLSTGFKILLPAEGAGLGLEFRSVPHPAGITSFLSFCSSCFICWYFAYMLVMRMLLLRPLAPSAHSGLSFGADVECCLGAAFVCHARLHGVTTYTVSSSGSLGKSVPGPEPFSSRRLHLSPLIRDLSLQGSRKVCLVYVMCCMS